MELPPTSKFNFNDYIPLVALSDHLLPASLISELRRIQWKNERPKNNMAYCPTRIEHIANIISHGIWIPPVIYYSLTLIWSATTPSQFWAAVIYGFALIGLFSVSTIFHTVACCGTNSGLRDVLHRGDRAMIYLFIAGSYTPWLTLRHLPDDGWANELRWAVWVLASLGILYQQMFHEKYKALETLFYILIACMPSLAVLEMNTDDGLFELKLGGAIYIVGVIFFKSDGRIPLAHAIWHLHVIAGAMIHFHAVSTYLIGPHNPL